MIWERTKNKSVINIEDEKTRGRKIYLPDLYNEMMTVPGKNLFSQIGNQTVKNTCCKECTDTLGNKIRQNAEVVVENTFCLSKDAQTAGCGGCSGQKYTSHVWQYRKLEIRESPEVISVNPSSRY